MPVPADLSDDAPSPIAYSPQGGRLPLESAGFGIEQTQIHYPDRVARLILVMALALYWAVSTGMWDAIENLSAAEKKPLIISLRKVARSKLSWFARGLRKLVNLLLRAMLLPKL